MSYFESWKKWAREEKIFIPKPYLGMTEEGYLDLRISNLPIQARCFDRSLVEKRTLNCPALLSDKDEVVETPENSTANIWFWFGLKPEKDPSTKKDLPGSLIVDPNYRCWVITHPVDSRFIILPSKLILHYQTGRPTRQPTIHIPQSAMQARLHLATTAQASTKTGRVADKMSTHVGKASEASVHREKIKTICGNNVKVLESSEAPQSKDTYAEVKEGEAATSELRTEAAKCDVAKEHSLPTVSSPTTKVGDHTDNRVKKPSLSPIKPLQSQLNKQSPPPSEPFDSLANHIRLQYLNNDAFGRQLLKEDLPPYQHSNPEANKVILVSKSTQTPPPRALRQHELAQKLGQSVTFRLTATPTEVNLPVIPPPTYRKRFKPYVTEKEMLDPQRSKEGPEIGGGSSKIGAEDNPTLSDLIVREPKNATLQTITEISSTKLVKGESMDCFATDAPMKAEDMIQAYKLEMSLDRTPKEEMKSNNHPEPKEMKEAMGCEVAATFTDAVDKDDICKQIASLKKKYQTKLQSAKASKMFDPKAKAGHLPVNSSKKERSDKLKEILHQKQLEQKSPSEIKATEKLKTHISSSQQECSATLENQFQKKPKSARQNQSRNKQSRQKRHGGAHTSLLEKPFFPPRQLKLRIQIENKVHKMPMIIDEDIQETESLGKTQASREPDLFRDESGSSYENQALNPPDLSQDKSGSSYENQALNPPDLFQDDSGSSYENQALNPPNLFQDDSGSSYENQALNPPDLSQDKSGSSYKNQALNPPDLSQDKSGSSYENQAMNLPNLSQNESGSQYENQALNPPNLFQDESGSQYENQALNPPDLFQDESGSSYENQALNPPNLFQDESGSQYENQALNPPNLFQDESGSQYENQALNPPNLFQDESGSQYENQALNPPDLFQDESGSSYENQALNPPNLSQDESGSSYENQALNPPDLFQDDSGSLYENQALNPPDLSQDKSGSSYGNQALNPHDLSQDKSGSSYENQALNPPNLFQDQSGSSYENQALHPPDLSQDKSGSSYENQAQSPPNLSQDESGSSYENQAMNAPNLSQDESGSSYENQALNLPNLSQDESGSRQPDSSNGEPSTKSTPGRKALKPKKKRKRCRFCCIQ